MYNRDLGILIARLVIFQLGAILYLVIDILGMCGPRGQ